VDVLTTYRASGEVVFRLFKGADGPILKSDYSLNKPPRGPQRRSALVHMGLSMWLSEESARSKNDDFGGKLGDHIAVLELMGELGVWWAQTFSPEHMTVWGRSEALDGCIRDIHPV
jgi:hypothetical protein